MQEDYTTKGRMAEKDNKNTLHLLHIQQILGSILACFHLFLVFVLFTGPSLLETKLRRNFFPSLTTTVGLGILEVNKFSRLWLNRTNKS